MALNYVCFSFLSLNLIAMVKNRGHMGIMSNKSMRC